MKTIKDFLPYGKPVAALIIGAAPPPTQLLGWPILVSVLAYCGVFLYIKPRVKNRRNQARNILFIAGLVAVAITIAYLGEVPVRTAAYRDQRVIIGDSLEPISQKWINNNESNVHDLLFYKEGDAEQVWIPQSLAGNTRIVASLYFSLIFFISFVLLGTVEFIPDEANWNWLWILLFTALLVFAVVIALYYDLAYRHILRGMFSRLLCPP